MVIALKTTVVWLFTGIVWGSIQVALQQRPTLSPWLVYGPLALIFVIIACSMLAARRAR